MPLADYRCPSCGRTTVDVLYKSSEGPHRNAPWCCATHTIVRMEWLPQIGRMDVQGGGGFTGFDTYVRGRDGQEKLVHVASLNDLRRIERETEQAYRNGEGQPMRWRDYAQDHSNRDVNTFGPDPGQQVRAELAAAQANIRGRKDHLKTLRGADAEQASRTLGPGVTESSASPFAQAMADGFEIDFTPTGE